MDVQLQAALDQVRQRSGGPGSSALLAQVGNLLKGFGVEPKRLPGPLGMVLRSMPDFCRVEGDHVLFLPGGERPSLSGSSPPENEAPKQLESQGEAWIRPDLWTALVKFQDGLGHYLNLETLQITSVPVNDSQPGPPVADDPVRYIRIPTIPTAEQQEPLRHLLADSLPKEQVEALFSSFDWGRQLHETLPPILGRDLAAERRRQVLERAQSFLHEHNIPPHNFVRQGGPSHARANLGGDGQRVSGSDGALHQGLRQMLHECIDIMSQEELNLIQLPARVLLHLKRTPRIPG